MEDVLQYAGKRTVVTGCSSGMGEATARILDELGADVIGIDIKEPTTLALRAFHTVDLRDRAAIEAAADAIDGPVDAVFSVAGLPGPPFSDLDTILVNFVGAKHLIDLLVPKMPNGSAAVCVASNAGLGWEMQINDLLPIVQMPDFDDIKKFYEEHPEKIEHGYVTSKKLLNAWVAWRSAGLMSQGIRLNCSNPGPTQTPMMPAFEDQAGKETIDAFVGPSGRRSLPEEQAWPLVLVNSPRASYIAGEAMHVDGGFLGAMITGQI